jgi:hypothetical protein
MRNGRCDAANLMHPRLRIQDVVSQIVTMIVSNRRTSSPARISSCGRSRAVLMTACTEVNVMAPLAGPLVLQNRRWWQDILERGYRPERIGLGAAI